MGDEAARGERRLVAARLRAALALVAVVSAAASALGTGVRASYGAQVSGDEPHYLLTALSLGEDRDLDVSDEIDRRRHAPFHEAGLDPQARRLSGGRRVSPHDPLLSVVLSLPMAWGGWVAAKLALAGIAGGLAALLLWVCVRRFGVTLPGALAVVLVFSASAPIAVYGTQVYPEVPAALAATGALAIVWGAL